MKCPGCGYHINSDRQTTCKLCGTDLQSPGGDAHGHGRSSSPAREAAAPARTAARPDWQRHVLLRVGAPPLELKGGQTLTIGRSSDAGLSVPSPRVSRAHAEIVWREGRPVLRDLASQNGTSVNGLKVAEHALADHDEVSIGPYTCTYRCLSGYGSVGKMQGLIDAALSTSPMLGDTLSGQLAQTSLFEVLQMLEVSQKTGQVDVYCEESAGRVVLDEGRIIHASEGDRAGAPALQVLLGWPEGLFRFTAEVEGDPEQNLPGNQPVLMYEAARRLAAEAEQQG
ncbi:MAG: DUF4388 domain-containing protein [Planctomycetes bacterium]|nr:DUF4388 domain-containing protein [Planctomycetota bacterium]